MRKRTAFKVGLGILVAFFFLVVFKAPDQLPTVGTAIVYAIAAATIGYQAANVADNAVKGKWYRPELAHETPPRGSAPPAKDGT